jgi:hypothetical protein
MMGKHQRPLKPTTKESGYCRPPEHSKWKAGRSGNPSGKRKGTKNWATILADVLEEPVSLSKNGESRKITALEGLVRVQRDAGLKGNLKSTAWLVKARTAPSIQAELEELVYPSREEVMSMTPEEAQKAYRKLIRQ